jgi:serine/threonine-protein kinase
MKHCTVCKAKYEDAVSFCPADGEVLEDDPSSIVNTVLDGQYQIESMLGKGGMGAVFLARHILLGDRVAIKVLPPEMRNNAEWLRRFRREGQAARRFRHPNAVTVYDLRTASDGLIYMVMEYVEGRTLDAELKARGSFTPAEAFEILEPIMSVLDAAHAMGVVHRDLKPENIMIGKVTTGGEPNVKLLDLGIAKLREVGGSDSGGNTALTMAGQMLGTPYYMSPEQWGELPLDGDPDIDGRADIYSLGLVFYEIIVGCRPYTALTLLELRKEHVTVIAHRLDEVVPDVPLAFSAAIARAMAKDRGDRPATASALATDLKAALATRRYASSGVSAASDLAKRPNEGPAVTVEKTAQTKSDVNAATIVTLDIGPGAAPKAGPASPATFAPTIAESAEMASSITVPQAPKPRIAQPPEAAPPIAAAGPQVAVPSRRSSMLPIVGGLLLLILIVVGVGGFFVMNWMKARSADTLASATGESRKATARTGPAIATPKEVARYWLELLPTALGAEPLRVAGVVPLASGQPFKFHFVLNDDGYVYIVGPGEQNQLSTFLTAKPAPISGLQSNHATKGTDLSFPNGLDHWLELDKKPGTEDYTIIISPQPLVSPGFLNEQAGRSLTPAEQAEWTNFLAKYKTSLPTTEVNEANNAEPFVTVKLPNAPESGDPVTLNVRIHHK